MWLLSKILKFPRFRAKSIGEPGTLAGKASEMRAPVIYSIDARGADPEALRRLARGLRRPDGPNSPRGLRR